MKRAHIDGRLFVPELTARLERDGEHLQLRSPAVGQWRGAPLPGQLVIPGGPVGELEILGVLHRVRAPDAAAGLVLEPPGPRLARRAVGYDDVLVTLDPDASPAAVGPTVADERGSADGLMFRTPLSGRFYARPAPGQDAFVSVGDIVKTGQTIALLEVMKTFNRVTYGGDGLPDRARVLAVEPADEADVDEGDVLLRVEPA